MTDMLTSAADVKWVISNQHVFETSIITMNCIYDISSPLKLTPQRKVFRILEDRLSEVRRPSRGKKRFEKQSFQNKAFQKDFPMHGKAPVRNASRRKALHMWYPSCSLIKLDTSQQAIIFVCFSPLVKSAPILHA